MGLCFVWAEGGAKREWGFRGKEPMSIRFVCGLGVGLCCEGCGPLMGAWLVGGRANGLHSACALGRG